MAFQTMNKILISIAFVCCLLIFPYYGLSQDSLMLKGQLSGWGNLNGNNDLPVWSGVRYIPSLNYSIKKASNRMFDMEVSVNAYGSLGFHPFDTAAVSGKIKPYRLWARYSTSQFELRLGLQKINFGSASMLRPLMWFDQLDARDPLQLTDGVWGLLGRYYFINNANLWLWGLYGNNESKAWETGKTNRHFPELGGRFQTPVPKGEMAVSYHFREADTRNMNAGVIPLAQIPENRLGLDGKWDVGIGLWFEGSWTHKSKNIGIFTNQEILNLGTDYTFGLGNGLNMVFENLFVSYDRKAFDMQNSVFFTGTSLSYPIGMVDNLSTIFYYDWTSRNLYSFLNWKRQFNKISFYIMAFWNPQEYKMPQQNETGNLFAGKGFQLMLVYNH